MLSRIAFNNIVRAARVNPTIRSVAPYRWVSLTFFIKFSSDFLFSNHHKVVLVKEEEDPIYQLLVAGGLTVLVGG